MHIRALVLSKDNMQSGSNGYGCGHVSSSRIIVSGLAIDGHVWAPLQNASYDVVPHGRAHLECTPERFKFGTERTMVGSVFFNHFRLGRVRGSGPI